MVDAENKEKWDDAQQVRGGACSPPPPTPPRTHPCLGPLYILCLQVSPGSVHLLRVVEDFIHLVGDALKAFQSSLIVTDNLGTRRQAREPGLEKAEPRLLWGRDGFCGALATFLSLWVLSFLHLTPSLYLCPCLFSPSPYPDPVVSLCVCPPPACLYQPWCLRLPSWHLSLPFLFLLL